MRRTRRNKVKQEKANVENPLREHDNEPLEKSRLGDLDEGHQMHALVLGLLHQRADPAVVIDHAPQAVQMLDGAADHAGNSGHGFQHNCAVPITFGEKSIGSPAQHLGKAKREMVGKSMRHVVDSRLRQLLADTGEWLGFDLGHAV